MTGVDVDALDAARAAATPGPWSSDATIVLGPDEIEIVDCWESSADAALIVAAVNALPELLAEVRRGRALREAVEGLAEELAESDREGDNGGWGDGATAAERGIADRLCAALTAVDAS